MWGIKGTTANFHNCRPTWDVTHDPRTTLDKLILNLKLQQLILLVLFYLFFNGSLVLVFVVAGCFIIWKCVVQKSNTQMLQFKVFCLHFCWLMFTPYFYSGTGEFNWDVSYKLKYVLTFFHSINLKAFWISKPLTLTSLCCINKIKLNTLF